MRPYEYQSTMKPADYDNPTFSFRPDGELWQWLQNEQARTGTNIATIVRCVLHRGIAASNPIT